MAPIISSERGFWPTMANLEDAMGYALVVLLTIHCTPCNLSSMEVSNFTYKYYKRHWMEKGREEREVGRYRKFSINGSSNGSSSKPSRYTYEGGRGGNHA